MQYYLRFLCYNHPNRLITTQIHPDIKIIDPPEFSYNDGVRVGDDAVDPATWPQYVVAHIVHMKQVSDPVNPSKNALVFEVFLARYEDWEQFDVPEMVLEAMNDDGE